MLKVSVLFGLVSIRLDAGTRGAGSTLNHQLSNRMTKVIRHTDESNKQCNVTSMQQEASLYLLRMKPCILLSRRAEAGYRQS